MIDLFPNNQLDEAAVIQLLDRPDCGIVRLPGDGCRFGSTLPTYRDERGIFYDPNHFVIDVQYRAIWIKAGVCRTAGGWHWQTDAYKTYEELGIVTSDDLLRVLRDYVPRMTI